MNILKRLSLALALLILASAILLISDWNQRRDASDKTIRIAILKFASRPTLDDGVAGMIRGLGELGFQDGKNLEVKHYNAEGDLNTANAIARDITDGRFEMVLTASTPAMQVVANANKQGRAIHIFGIVTDPAGSGVGVGRKNPLDHPPHMAGIGTFQPVAEVFRLAKRIHPALKTVGVVWSPGEACSVACLEIGRNISRELGITLVEATVDSTVGVREATESLVSRGVQAIWIGGDNIVELAAPTLIAAATRSGIPVFTNNPDQAFQGALFSLGANYSEVGRRVGLLAGEVLKGKSPASIPVENVVPPQLVINKDVLKRLRTPWQFPEQVLVEVHTVIEGGHAANKSSDLSPLTRKQHIALIKYVESPASEEGERGIRKGFAASGLHEGKDYDLKIRSAQGDMMLLGTVMDAVVAEKPEKIPFVPVDKSDLIVNLKAAREFGVVVPPVVLKKVKKVLGQ